MTRRDPTNFLTRSLKHVRIGLGALALMLIPVSVHASGGADTILSEVANAAEMASSDVVDTLDTIGEEFALSEPVYRGTDRGDAILILASVFSVIVAFNLWLLWHLHRAYAPRSNAGAEWILTAGAVNVI
jgi:hypothetical protein